MILLVIFLLTVPLCSEGARILAVYPTPSISHQVVFRPLTDELVRRGHEVVVITADPAYPRGEAPANLTEIDMHDMSYDIWRKTFIQAVTGNSDERRSQYEFAMELLSNIAIKQIFQEDTQNVIANKTFDLILAEACVPITLVMSHIYKAPLIQISSFGGMSGNYWTIGATEHPFLNPTVWFKKLNNPSLWDKVKEFYTYYSVTKMYYEHEEQDNVRLKKYFGPDVPTRRELSDNVNMFFVNMHPIWDGNRPVPPGVVFMGGIHQKPQKELPNDLKTYLDSSKNGVIYMSFGTNVNPSMLSPEKIQIFVKVFSKLPYDILWKWNSDVLPGQSENIKISKWLPQSDLLRHPNIKLFITQGGLQSTDEALTAGVPLIGIPMLGDQWYNAEKYVYHGIGKTLDIVTLDGDQLRDAITTIIGDQSYYRNTVKLGELMRDHPQPPLENAAWWVEHILRHGGGKHLRAPGANISWTEYYEIKLFTLLLSGLFIAIISIVTTLYVLYKYVGKNAYAVKLKMN